MNLSDWSRIIAAIDQLPTALLRLAQVETDMEGLKIRMTSEETTTARLDQVTNNLANDVSTIRTELSNLRNAMAGGNQAAIDAAMERLGPHIDSLESMENILRGLPGETHTVSSETPASGAIASAPIEGQDVETGITTAEGAGVAGSPEDTGGST